MITHGLVWLYANKQQEELDTKIIIVSGDLVLSHDGSGWTATRHTDYPAADAEAVNLSGWAEAAGMELNTGPLTFSVDLVNASITTDWTSHLITRGTGRLLLEGVGFVDMVVAVTQAGMETVLPNQYHRVL